MSERILLRAADQEIEGWALNVSRGGVRCIVEERLELGAEVELTIGAEGESQLTRKGRVVWAQDESDGCVVGIEFLNVSGTHRSSPPPPPDPEG